MLTKIHPADDVVVRHSEIPRDRNFAAKPRSSYCPASMGCAGRRCRPDSGAHDQRSVVTDLLTLNEAVSGFQSALNDNALVDRHFLISSLRSGPAFETVLREEFEAANLLRLPVNYGYLI